MVLSPFIQLDNLYKTLSVPHCVYCISPHFQGVLSPNEIWRQLSSSLILELAARYLMGPVRQNNVVVVKPLCDIQ